LDFAGRLSARRKARCSPNETAINFGLLFLTDLLAHGSRARLSQGFGNPRALHRQICRSRSATQQRWALLWAPSISIKLVCARRGIALPVACSALD
jgi:hypothetical protein